MAVSAGTAALQVVPTLTKNFSRDLATQLAGPAARTSEKAGKEHGRRFGTSFSGGLRAGVGPVKTIFRGFGPGLAAAFGGAALIAGIKSVTDEAREAAVVGKQTAAVLKSTGGVAKVTAKHVADLAQSISNATGVDDELIQSGQNWLLTFKNVRNEAGKGNDVFDRASKSAVDLAASMHQGQVSASGLHSANTLLGKALNDPIKGMTALSRAGVTFNAQQQEQIKTLVKSGNVLGAQKIILGEVESQTKGFAAASADSGQRFGVFVNNIKEQIGTALLPIMNRLLGFLVDQLPGAFRTVGGAISFVVRGFDSLRDAFGGNGITTEAGNFFGIMERIGVALRAVWSTIIRLVVPAFRSIADALKPAIAAFVSGLLPGLKSLAHVVVTQLWPALKIIAAIIGVTLYAALKYVLPLLLRLAGPVLGFLLKQLAQTIQWISNVIRWIGRVGAWLARWITGTKTTGEAIKELGRRVGVFASNMAKQWSTIVRQVGAALGFLKRTTVNVLSFMIRLWLRWAGSIIDAAAAAMGWLPGLGPKLRRAQTKFHEFANGVNRALDKIKNKTVVVRARAAVEIAASTRMYLRAAQVPGFHAKGTLLPGYGGGDIVPAMLEPGEAVVPKDKARRPEFRSWAKSMGIPGFRDGTLVRGYRAGGSVMDVRVQPSDQNERVGQFYSKTVEATRRTGELVAKGLADRIGKGLSKAIEGGAGGMLGGGSGPGGWQWQMRVLRKAFPGLQLISGFRPGAVTHATGRQSYHAVGRAVDVPPRMDVFNWIRGNYGRRTKELIFSPAGGRQIHNGQPHMYTGVTRADHFNHVHWAYDKGGMLPTGTSLATNTTGRPEPVGFDYDKLAVAIVQAQREHPPVVYLDRQKVTRAVQTGALLEKRRR